LSYAGATPPIAGACRHMAPLGLTATAHPGRIALQGCGQAAARVCLPSREAAMEYEGSRPI
jgi:hypothetical protein